ncbi:NADH:flavin oxidoreductase [Shewanella fidelis]|uniref:NADH:flavin oxidoreductase n=1 Tax=Shewanella fidelis TaxID=173509 RepID=A0AAW8NRD4_9GAMM|nr:NADH:flavin oxidoreductase [Shewanella fidelis]MDR8525677.1 NADH:flavin oxidoreductase [Shewanella fidelis]MDW4812813.1 NADH:flavin oxidoreductase [Shewanella fidelis]MDW4816561.1 NADH:flavin oxidoreductase [Shewanella fidelis]MDW4820275.1 NADH:flavin oxidoreductase [Shewanella fidelis]MDW4825278.1 NADH:flavin oxidoreductase [Shewanella fidelis]
MSILFSAARIGNMTLKNRFVRSATWENMATETGHMTDKLYSVYEELAKGEVGLIVTGYANIVAEEKPNAGMMGMYDDSFIAEYQKLTELVHGYDSKIVMQLAYGGTKTTYNVGERVIFAPSAIAERGTQTMGKAMTKDEINYIVQAFAKASYRAQQSGFDGVEIHAAHTYLINQFLSPYYNQRQDEYGGSLENRMRFLLEIYAEIRKLVGNDYPILVKLTASEFFDGGLTFAETRLICQKLESVGGDAIIISGNIHGNANTVIGEQFDGYTIQSEGYFREFGAVVSQEVNLPVITVGGLADICAIEELAQTTNIALFALSRPLLAEPQLIKRWQEGSLAEVDCERCSKCRTKRGNFCVVYKKR